MIPECMGCSACCRFDFMPLKDGELPDQVEHIQIIDGVRTVIGTDTWWCPFVDANKCCTVYDIRPQICRDTLRGGPVCLHALDLAKKL
jgi:Fe-S-cluster containining protein